MSRSIHELTNIVGKADRANFDDLATFGVNVGLSSFSFAQFFQYFLTPDSEKVMCHLDMLINPPGKSQSVRCSKQWVSECVAYTDRGVLHHHEVHFQNYWKSVLSHVFSPLSLFTECDMKNKMVVTASLLSLFVQWETVNKKLIGWTWNPLVPGYWLSTPRHHRSVCFSCMQGLIVQSKQSLILKKKVGTLLICLRN